MTLLSEWQDDCLLTIQTKSDGDLFTVAQIYLTTTAARKENKSRSESGGISAEADILKADLIISEKRGISADAITRRIARQYPNWWLSKRLCAVLRLRKNPILEMLKASE